MSSCFEDILMTFAQDFENFCTKQQSLDSSLPCIGNGKMWNFRNVGISKNDVSVIFYIKICTATAFLILSPEGPRLLVCRFAMFNISLRNSSDERFQSFVCKTRQISSCPVRWWWTTEIRWRQPRLVPLGCSAEGILSEMYVSWCTIDYRAWFSHDRSFEFSVTPTRCARRLVMLAANME